MPEPKVAETPKASEEAPLIDNPRTAIENAIVLENETPAPPIEEPETPAEEVKEEAKVEPVLTEVDRIKQAMQKRINKVVAKSKSAEEELVEARAEIAELRAKLEQKINAETKSEDKSPPTLAQVTAYIVKMREEGNHEEAERASDYKLQLIEEAAFKKIEERQKSERLEAQTRTQRENQALVELAKDYVEYDAKGQPDMKSDMTLANQKGKLFQTAMALYQDSELNKLYYNDPDRANGFRRAVQDARRELYEQKLVTPKVDRVGLTRDPRLSLADPAADEIEETPAPTNSAILSDADKVREEIKQRNRLRNSRKPS